MASKRTFYPTLEEALRLHALLIEKFGGASGVRDPGLLESALVRPRSGYYKSLLEQAAALLHSLINNHCFVDGNKRMAFALAAVFLRLNGSILRVNAADAERFIVGRVIGKKAEVAEIAEWMGKHVVPPEEDAG